jgi:hypothetical protein
MYHVSSMMFASNDFLYNTDPLKTTIGEPKMRFTIDGCFAAMNHVLIERDWYTKGSGGIKIFTGFSNWEEL